MVEFNGLGHSAAIHTADEELTKEFGKAVKKYAPQDVSVVRCVLVSVKQMRSLLRTNIAKIDYSKMYRMWKVRREVSC